MSYFFLQRGAFVPPAGMRVFIDSGAFSAKTTGKPVRLADYIAWLHANKEKVRYYAALDVIGDPVRTRRNLDIMRAEGLEPVPVYHAGTPVEYFDRLVEERPELIAVGGMVQHLKGFHKESLKAEVAGLFTRAKGVPLHGFGVGTSLGALFPWRSCDASLIAQSCRYGVIYEYTRRHRQLSFYSLPKDGKARVSGRVDHSSVPQHWRVKRAQMRIAHAHGMSRSTLVAPGPDSRVTRVRPLLSAVGAFEAHMREEREFDFYFACSPSDVELIAKAMEGVA